MKSMAVLGVALITAPSVSSTEANTAGCLKGAVVGGVAGHYAGNHGLLAGGAGCLIGRHYAKKHAREQMMQDHYSTTYYRR